MPIGLPDFSELKGRAPERIVRSNSCVRPSTVFRIPSRSAVYASVDRTIPDDKARFRKACAVARKTSVDKKAFSKQAFYLCDKIVEVDKLLRTEKELIDRVFETHPEVAFCNLNNGNPVEPKKMNGRPFEQGLEQRRKLLIKAGVPNDIVRSTAANGARADDLLDALVSAVTARRIRAGNATAYPREWTRDAFDIPIVIWA